MKMISNGMKRIFLLIILFFVFMVPASFAQQAQQQEKQEIKEEELAVKYPEVKIKKPETAIKTCLTTNIGVDNNPYLDSSKKTDSFNQEVFNFYLKKNLPRNWGFNLKYQNNSVIYHHEKSVSFYENFLNFNFENNPVNWITVRFGYNFDFVYYNRLKNSSYFSHGPEASLRMYFTKNIYQEIGFEFLIKDFTKRKANDAINSSTDVGRKDRRPILYYEIGQYFRKSLLKFYTQHYKNESNDKYFDFYDYNSHQFGLTFIYALTKKFSYLADVGFERRDYSLRPSDLNSFGASTQKVKIYKINMGLFYDINQNLSANLTWSWRESQSNSPTYEYAGYITSCGLVYRF